MDYVDQGQGQEATTGNDNLYGYAAADTISAGGGDDIVYGYAGDDVIDGGNGVDNLQGGEGNDAIRGGTDSDMLLGGDGNDDLQGGAEGDTIYGDASNDLLDGGVGNDTLDGGVGDDVYLFGAGVGTDTIYAYDTTLGKVDTVQLSGLNAANITLRREGNDLLLLVNGASDSLRVSSHFYDDAAGGFQIDKIQFADGSSWDQSTIKAHAMLGTEGNDALYGYATNDTVSAGNGDDVIYGYAGDDVIDGGSGVDNLFGGEGNDSLGGGAGNDQLDGGAGSDTYLMGAGAHNDVIDNYDFTGADNDKVLFGAGIGEDQIWFQRVGQDLQLTLIETNDTLTVRSWYVDAAYHVDSFNLGNGKQLLEGQVDALVSAMAAFSPPAAGQTTLPANYQTTLNPVIAANWR